MTRSDNQAGGGSRAAGLWAQAAHDLRQPVQAALFLAGALGEVAEPAQVQRAAALIGSTLQSLGEMLDILALLARLDAGLEAVVPGACSMADGLQTAVLGLARAAERRGVPLRVAALAGVVQSHPALLVTAGKSLVMNAIRYGNGEGIDVGCRKSDDEMQLEVSFSGVLPDPGRGRNAFVSMPPADGHGGELGLGLPLLQHLCTLLGHDLRHAVRDGRHLFTLALPLPGRPAEGAPVSR